MAEGTPQSQKVTSWQWPRLIVSLGIAITFATLLLWLGGRTNLPVDLFYLVIALNLFSLPYLIVSAFVGWISQHIARILDRDCLLNRLTIWRFTCFLPLSLTGFIFLWFISTRSNYGASPTIEPGQVSPGMVPMPHPIEASLSTVRERSDEWIVVMGSCWVAWLSFHAFKFANERRDHSNAARRYVEFSDELDGSSCRLGYVDLEVDGDIVATPYKKICEIYDSCIDRIGISKSDAPRLLVFKNGVLDDHHHDDDIPHYFCSLEHGPAVVIPQHIKAIPAAVIAEVSKRPEETRVGSDDGVPGGKLGPCIDLLLLTMLSHELGHHKLHYTNRYYYVSFELWMAITKSVLPLAYATLRFLRILVNVSIYEEGVCDSLAADHSGDKFKKHGVTPGSVVRAMIEGVKELLGKDLPQYERSLDLRSRLHGGSFRAPSLAVRAMVPGLLLSVTIIGNGAFDVLQWAIFHWMPTPGSVIDLDRELATAGNQNSAPAAPFIRVSRPPMLVASRTPLTGISAWTSGDPVIDSNHEEITIEQPRPPRRPSRPVSVGGDEISIEYQKARTEPAPPRMQVVLDPPLVDPLDNAGLTLAQIEELLRHLHDIKAQLYRHMPRIPIHLGEANGAETDWMKFDSPPTQERSPSAPRTRGRSPSISAPTVNARASTFDNPVSELDHSDSSDQGRRAVNRRSAQNASTERSRGGSPGRLSGGPTPGGVTRTSTFDNPLSELDHAATSAAPRSDVGDRSAQDHTAARSHGGSATANLRKFQWVVFDYEFGHMIGQQLRPQITHDEAQYMINWFILHARNAQNSAITHQPPPHIPGQQPSPSHQPGPRPAPAPRLGARR